MFFVLVQYLWPRLAPCIAGVTVVAHAAYGVLGRLAPKSDPPVRAESEAATEWDEEAAAGMPEGSVLLRQRHPGVTALAHKECTERLQQRLTAASAQTGTPSPVPLQVGFELDVAHAFCCLASVDEVCDPAFVRVVVKVLQLLHCCGYSWEVTLKTLAIALVYAQSPCAGNRHGHCACAGIRSCRGLLEETWLPCSAFCGDSLSTATARCTTTYGLEPAVEPAANDRSTLAQDRVVVLIFLAHCYIVDDPCFLCTWNKYVFGTPRDIESLNGELRLFKARGYQLAADSDTVQQLYGRLKAAVRAHPTGKSYDLAGAVDAPA